VVSSSCLQEHSVENEGCFACCCTTNNVYISIVFSNGHWNGIWSLMQELEGKNVHVWPLLQNTNYVHSGHKVRMCTIMWLHMQHTRHVVSLSAGMDLYKVQIDYYFLWTCLVQNVQ
jgi:pheromone shutdown protein TraB